MDERADPPGLSSALHLPYLALVVLPTGILMSMLTSMGTSMDQADKVRENLLRRMAERQGLMLRKSTRRDPLSAGYGCFYVTRRGEDRGERGSLRHTSCAVAGVRDGVPCWTLDDAEKWLRGDKR